MTDENAQVDAKTQVDPNEEALDSWIAHEATPVWMKQLFLELRGADRSVLLANRVQADLDTADGVVSRYVDSLVEVDGEDESDEGLEE